jgi:hypothetical protein
MKKLTYVVLVCALFCVMAPALLAEGATASGTLNIGATVDPSISLTFENDASGVALSSGEGTNAATLEFGNIKAFGYTAPGGVTATTGATAFSVSTPVGVKVVQANGESLSYSLTAELNTADTTNDWEVSGVPVSSSSAASITNEATYGTAHQHTIKVTVPFSNITGVISNSINFVATAN